MLTEYLEAAMRRANYEILSDDNTFYTKFRKSFGYGEKRA